MFYELMMRSKMKVEKMPLTVVGNPTIVDGVVSGFDLNNYLQLSDLISVDDNFELVFKLEDIGTDLLARTIYRFNSANTLGLTATNRLAWNGVSGLYFDSGFNTSGILYIKAKKDGLNYSFGYSNDGVNYTTKNATLTTHPIYDTNNKILQSTNWQNIAVKFDTNNSYLIKNGTKYTFLLPSATTRTLKCVGATGTADLTQVDKDIALNKGWALTLS